MEKLERIEFLKRFITEPQKIGSLTPSSSYLTNKMLKRIDWEQLHNIAELGAGTGVFTRAIVAKKQQNCHFLIVEQDTEMLQNLKDNFPDCEFAAEAELLAERVQGTQEKFDFIVSGLPFAVLPVRTRIRIMRAVLNSLQEGGTFVTFQYSLQMLHMLKKYFTSVDVAFEPRNLPPAFVYYCQK